MHSLRERQFEQAEICEELYVVYQSFCVDLHQNFSPALYDWLGLVDLLQKLLFHVTERNPDQRNVACQDIRPPLALHRTLI